MTAGNVVIDEQPGTITLRIAKVDAATGAGPQVGASLAGAEFTCVSQSTPGWSHTLTTDEDGRATLTDIPLGTFTIYESRAPEGYLPPMKPGATPSVPISSETRASLSSSAASPTSPSLLTSKFQSSRTAVIVTNLV